MSDMSSFTPDNRFAPSRRAVVRTAVWTAPAVMVASAAPAFAGSACVSYTVAGMPWVGTLDEARTNMSFVVAGKTSSGALDPQPMTVTAQATAVGRIRIGGTGQNDYNNNYAVQNIAHPDAALEVPALNLQQYRHQVNEQSDPMTGREHYSEHTFKFSRPVTNLSFRIGDVDGGTGDGGYTDYRDAFYLKSFDIEGVLGAGPAVTVGAHKGGQVAGSGSDAQPFYSNKLTRIDHHDPAGHVDVIFPGTISGFVVRYWNRTSVSNRYNTQTIKIGQFTFDYEVCPPAR